MDIRLNLGNLNTPNDILRLTSIISEMADTLDVLITSTAPNGVTNSRQGKIALYNNGGTKELWVNTDGAKTWERMDFGATHSIYGDTRFKIGKIPFDLSTAPTTTVVTGLGFSPKIIEFKAIIPATVFTSDGFDDGTNHYCRFYDSTNVQWASSDTRSIVFQLQPNTPSTILGYVSALGSDGFTITWTKGGSPTGNAEIYYKASR